MASSDVHPDAVLEALLAKGVRSNRRANLERMHALCRSQHAAGSRDFSVATIGKLAEADGIMKGRALYNAASADYRALIAAWAAYAGPPDPTPPKALASHDYLMRIEDPAIRSIMQAIIAERDKLKAQLNTLKAQCQVTVDRRSSVGAASGASEGSQVTVLSPAARLTPTERQALEKAVSHDYLEEQGLREGTHGEILNDRGRTLFQEGFARGLRKLLG